MISLVCTNFHELNVLYNLHSTSKKPYVVLLDDDESSKLQLMQIGITPIMGSVLLPPLSATSKLIDNNDRYGFGMEYDKYIKTNSCAYQLVLTLSYALIKGRNVILFTGTSDPQMFLPELIVTLSYFGWINIYNAALYNQSLPPTIIPGSPSYLTLMLAIYRENLLPPDQQMVLGEWIHQATSGYNQQQPQPPQRVINPFTKITDDDEVPF